MVSIIEHIFILPLFGLNLFENVILIENFTNFIVLILRKQSMIIIFIENNYNYIILFIYKNIGGYNMGLFGGESKEEKRIRKEKEEMQKFMDKYQLNDLSDKDLVILKRIANDLAGNGFFKAGMALSFAKAEEQAKVTYLSALVEQNWMIIRLLSEINSKLDR